MAVFDSPLNSPANQTGKTPVPVKSFAQALSGAVSDVVSDDSFSFPPKVVMGNSVRVRISKAAYDFGLCACKTHLHGRLTLRKGDTPVTTQTLKTQFTKLWPNLQNWSLTPLGKGFFEFNFNSIEDMQRVWTLGSVNLKPGFMRFFCWTKDFNPHSQNQTHAHIWVRFMNLP
jgi:hypothetical protein